jgi:hypothetical protein
MNYQQFVLTSPDFTAFIIGWTIPSENAYREGICAKVFDKNGL